MFHPRLDKWRKPTETAGLLFFATALVDSLFDFTIDAHKASALNTHTRAVELESLAEGMSERRVLPNSLRPIVEELEDSIKNDFSLDGHTKQISMGLLKKVRSEVFSKGDVIKEDIHPYCEAVRNRIRSKYWAGVKQAILDVVSDPSRKEDCLRIVDIFVVEVEARGFDRRYLYRQAMQFFFEDGSGPAEITSTKVLVDFFSIFEQKPEEWSVVYRVSRSFETLSQREKVFNVDSSLELPQGWIGAPLWASLDESYVDFSKKDSKYPLYLRVSTKAKDPYSARLAADKILQHITDICTYHDHSTRLTWSGFVYVTNESGRYARVHRPKPNALHMGVFRDTNDDVGLRIVKTTKFLFSNRVYPQDRWKIMNALEYHRSAIRSPRHEGQLLDLWALMEGLLPVPRHGDNRLPHYRKYILSAIGMFYTKRIFESLAKNIGTSDSYVRKYVEGLPYGKSWNEKVSILISCHDAVDHRRALYSLLSNHPLLCNRCFRIAKGFGTPASQAKMIKNYITKAEWQINRIYLMRNQIVHNSQSYSHIPTLVENLHTYVDCLIEGVAESIRAGSGLVSIEAAVESLNASYDLMVESLASESTKYSIGDISTKKYSPGRPILAMLK
ncbi:MAG: hypothetical protein ACSHX5_00375 [Phycisphaerales bacterium]